MTELEITGDLSEPFFEGTPANTGVPALTPCGLGGHGYILDLAKFKRSTIPIFREPLDQFPEPGEHSLNTRGIWRHTTANWRFGAGQKFKDADDSERRQFRISKGIKWVERDQISLLPTADSKLTTTATNLRVLNVGAYLYVLDNTDLRFTADPTIDTPVWTTVALGGTGAEMCTDGTYVYIACSASGIKRTTIGSSAAITAWSATASSFIAYHHGVLISASANVLSQVSSAAAFTTITTLFSTAATFIASTDTPSGILLAVNEVARGRIYFMGFNAATGLLAVPTSAGEADNGEICYALLHYAGKVILGTTMGVRTADIIQERALNIGPVISDPGTVKCLSGDGQYVSFGWTNYDSSSTGLGLLDMGRFTEELVPAYGSDLMTGVAESPGILLESGDAPLLESGDLLLEEETIALAQGAVISVTSFGGLRYFGVSGANIWGESTTLVESGTLSGGWLRYGTYEKKIAVSLDLRFEPLEGEISATLTLDDDSSVNAGSVEDEATTQPLVPLSLSNAESEALELNLTLTRSSTDTTAGPTLRRATLRAAAVPLRTDEIVLPIINKTMVETSGGEGQDKTYNPREEFLFLKSLEASRTPVTLQLGQMSELVIVDLIEVEAHDWQDRNDWFQSELLVHCLTLEPTGSS